MDFMQILKAVFALAIVLGLILMLAYVLKRYAPQLMAQLQAKRGEKRLQVVETLVLDPARRLVLVRLDNEERLILLGEGHELIEPRPKHEPAARPAAAPVEVAPVAEPQNRPRPSISLAAGTRVSATARSSAAVQPKDAPRDISRDANDDLF